ncbi:hypothetical protein [uncultured Draconibacterium sp.]|uniref:hypothetical protein n=1 Tax=uncultured Draconibacterium sp. TaxID=1573823 RepID=UPI00321639A7
MTEPKITLKKLLGFGYEKENNLFLSSPKKGKLTYQPVETPPKPEDNKLDSLIELDKEKMLNNLNNR